MFGEYRQCQQPENDPYFRLRALARTNATAGIIDAAYRYCRTDDHRIESLLESVLNLLERNEQLVKAAVKMSQESTQPMFMFEMPKRTQEQELERRKFQEFMKRRIQDSMMLPASVLSEPVPAGKIAAITGVGDLKFEPPLRLAPAERLAIRSELPQPALIPADCPDCYVGLSGQIEPCEKHRAAS